MIGDTDTITSPQGTDATAGSGQPASEGETQAPADPTGGTGSNGTGGGSGTPPNYRRDIAYNLALADLMKPIETAATDLFAPEKQPARDAILKAYADAVAAPNGTLYIKKKKANDSFDRAAADMLAALDNWTPRLKDKSTPLGALLDRRASTLSNLTSRTGKNEGARATKQQATKDWAARFADWAAPADAIGKIVDGYLTQIDKLNADINNEVNKDAAILSFWFEVAPRHLQISDKALGTNAQQALAKMTTALTAAGYTDLADGLDPTKSRANGGVTLISADAQTLQQKREEVFMGWKAAAEAQAGAEADYKLDPDDTPTLKAAWDKLKGDAWIKDAKASLTTAS